MAHQCDKCNCDFPYSLERCPHCAHPGNYSNVVITSGTDERNAVDTRYQEAASGAERRRCRPRFDEFTKWLEGTRAVVARSYADIERLAASDKSVQATYYDLIDSGLTLPDGSLWEELRRPADEVLFPNYREKIRFGALSGDGIGIVNYGHFWMTLRTGFVEHRTSVFDQNSVVYVSERRLRDAAGELLGHRANWKDRAKLAAAQLADQIRRSTRPDDFPTILMKQGLTTASDRFIEVHVWGPITVRTVESVKYRRSLVHGKIPRTLLKNLSIALGRLGSALEEIP